MIKSSSSVHGVNKARKDKDNPDYQIYNNRYLKDNNFKDFSGFYTYFQCLAKCEEYRDCRSFDFDHNRRKCYLSKKSKRSKGVSFNTHGDMIYGENKKRLGDDVKPPPTNQPKPACDKYWIPYEGHCYYFGTSSKRQDQARAICKAFGGELADIYNKAENEFILKNFKSGQRYWIGLQRKSNKYVWANGKQATYFDWKSGEPDKTGPCVRIENKKWRDMTCSRYYRYVCKKKSSKNCNVDLTSRVLCGYSGISQSECTRMGCCYNNQGSIKCFKRKI